MLPHVLLLRVRLVSVYTTVDFVRKGRVRWLGALLSADRYRCWRLTVGDGNRNVPV
jgi:hypothetical protein